VKLGFTRSNVDPKFYFNVVQGMPLILVLYVDDLFLIGSEPLMIECKRKLASKFEMKDLGLMHYFLGLEVWQRPGEIFLSQGKYIVKLHEKFGMTEMEDVICLVLTRGKWSPCFLYTLTTWTNSIMMSLNIRNT